MTVDAPGAAAAGAEPPFAVWLVSDVYPPGCGGSGWSAHALAQTLAARGHAVEVVTLDSGSTGVSQRLFEGIPVSELGVAAARRNPMRRLGARDYAHALLEEYLSARLTTDDDVRVLHAQHLHSGPPTVAAAARAGRASVQTLRDYWPVCLHGTSWWNGDECPGCDTVNLTGCMGEYWRWPSPLARLMVGWARRRLAARRRGVTAADRVIAVSDWVRRRVEREVPGARYTVLPNIVDVDAVQDSMQTASATELPWDEPYLVAAGKLTATKGFAGMLDALAAADCRLPVVIAGTGARRAELEQRASALGIRLALPGWIAHDALLRLIGEAHAFLLPGAWNEPMSRLLLEALALGTPVIAWNSGGNPEHLSDGVDALVIEDADGLRDALAQLSDPQRARAIGAAGTALARCVFSPQALYPRILDVYRAARRRHESGTP